ncbi:unnamed protein product [Chrysoparadoxa australica]
MSSRKAEGPTQDAAANQAKEQGQVKRKVDEESYETCSICFEQLNNTGSHSAAALKCGHVYGISCLQQWVGKGKKRQCPLCGKLAGPKDIIPLFLSKGVVVNERGELEACQEQLRQAEKATGDLRKENAKLEMEVKRLRTEQRRNRGLGNLTTRDQGALSRAAINSGRVCHITPCDMLLVSQQLGPKTGSGPEKHGITKFSLSDSSSQESITLHDKQVRGIDFSQRNDGIGGLALTTAFDKLAIITDTASNAVVKTFKLPSRGWSCAWSKRMPGKQLFVGVERGKVLMFDTRRIGGEPLMTYESSAANAPVHTVAHTLDDQLICCGMDRLRCVHVRDGRRGGDEHELGGCCGAVVVANGAADSATDSWSWYLVTAHRGTTASYKAYGFGGGEESGFSLVKQFCGHDAKMTLSNPCAFVAGGELTLIGADETTMSPWMWKSSSDQVVRKLQPHSSHITSIATWRATGTIDTSRFVAYVSSDELTVMKDRFH